MEKTMGEPTSNDGAVSFSKQEQFSTILKCVLFWLVFVGLLFLGGSFLVPLFRKDWSSMFYGVVGMMAALITISFFLKIENRSFRNIGLVFEWKSMSRFISGYLIGTIIFTIMITILMVFSDLQLHKNKFFLFSPTILISYLAIIPLGMMEELAFRSYSFVKLNSKFNFRITQFIIAIAFAAYHIIGGQSILSALLGPGVWAYVFGLATIRSGGIAMPLGVHVAANVSQSLCGMKGKNDAIWILEYSVQPAEDALRLTNSIGVTMHIVMLVIAVFLTELFVRKTRKA